MKRNKNSQRSFSKVLVQPDNWLAVKPWEYVLIFLGQGHGFLIGKMELNYLPILFSEIIFKSPPPKKRGGIFKHFVNFFSPKIKRIFSPVRETHEIYRIKSSLVLNCTALLKRNLRHSALDNLSQLSHCYNIFLQCQGFGKEGKNTFFGQFVCKWNNSLLKIPSIRMCKHWSWPQRNNFLGQTSWSDFPEILWKLNRRKRLILLFLQPQIYTQGPTQPGFNPVPPPKKSKNNTIPIMSQLHM